MSIVLKPNEVCKYANTCIYNSGKGSNKFCRGAEVGRDVTFLCDLVTDDGIIKENKFRSELDQTGKMKIILEQVK